MARFDKQDEENQLLDETELFINLNINHNITESDIDIFDVKFSLEHQIQQQEMKESGWRFDNINSMTIYFYKTGEMNGTSYAKDLLRNSATLKFENIDNFVSSILPHLILVEIVILTEFQIKNNIQMKLILMVLISETNSNVVMSIGLTTYTIYL